MDALKYKIQELKGTQWCDIGDVGPFSLLADALDEVDDLEERNWDKRFRVQTIQNEREDVSKEAPMKKR